MNKRALSETDIRTKFITPAIVGEDSAGWDLMSQVRETVKWDPEILFHSPMLQLPVLMSQLIQF